MTIQAVVFDLDGVLIDSEPCWQRARTAFARARGCQWSESLQRQAMGTSTTHWLALMQQHIDPSLTTEAILAEMMQRLRDEYAAHLPLRHGARAAVERLTAHYPVALASGSPTALIDEAMARSGLGRLMTTIVYGDSVAQGKPAPDIYLEALRRLGLAPAEAVGIEDSANGVRALAAAGLWSIAAPAPEFELPADIMALADWRIHDLDALTPDAIRALDDAP